MCVHIYIYIYINVYIRICICHMTAQGSTNGIGLYFAYADVRLSAYVQNFDVHVEGYIYIYVYMYTVQTQVYT